MEMTGKGKLQIEVRKKSTPEIRAYLRKNPSCTYEELIKALNLTSLSKPWFYTLRSKAREKGADSKGRPQSTYDGEPNMAPLMTVEILEVIDSSGFSDDLKRHYKSHVMPLLKKLLPGGPSIHLVQLADPPGIEIRKLIR
jgi:hypothetical protein